MKAHTLVLSYCLLPGMGLRVTKGKEHNNNKSYFATD